MLQIDPKKRPVQEIQRLLQGGIAPRPIALVSTLSEGGVPNLSPFSFFNAFGANPPVVVFSPSRRGRDGTTKDTYNNLTETRECVVQAVTYAMVRQISLASTEYPPDVDEFVKSGLTPIPSEIVKPPRVKESPFHMECRVHQIVPLGDERGSGNLVICEVVLFHVDESVMSKGIIDPHLIDLVGRNSADFYTRASGASIFEVEKPVGKTGIGFDNLPDYIKQSTVLTANNLAQLANCELIPDSQRVIGFINALTGDLLPSEPFNELIESGDYRKAMQVALSDDDRSEMKCLIHRVIKAALDSDDTEFAWKAIMYLGRI